MHVQPLRANAQAFQLSNSTAYIAFGPFRPGERLRNILLVLFGSATAAINVSIAAAMARPEVLDTTFFDAQLQLILGGPQLFPAGFTKGEYLLPLNVQLDEQYRYILMRVTETASQTVDGAAYAEIDFPDFVAFRDTSDLQSAGDSSLETTRPTATASILLMPRPVGLRSADDQPPVPTPLDPMDPLVAGQERGPLPPDDGRDPPPPDHPLPGVSR